MIQSLFEFRTALRLFGLEGLNDTVTFSNGDDLICLYHSEFLDLLCRRPLYFDEVHCISLPDTEMKSQVAL